MPQKSHSRRRGFVFLWQDSPSWRHRRSFYDKIADPPTGLGPHAPPPRRRPHRRRLPRRNPPHPPLGHRAGGVGAFNP
ncbi:MAG: hypothetical protein H6631_06055 [Anaerolineaceae bacterium]|nr:hypothetical protein [Anaerolineaceae bacterium]